MLEEEKNSALQHSSADTSDAQHRLPERREDRSLRDLFNRFLEEDFFTEPFDFSRNPRLASFFNRQLMPRVDVSESDTQIKIIADVPGVDPNNIDIDVQDNRMRISGFTQRQTSQDERPYRYERTYGEFRREFTLPSEVQKDKIKAVCKDGVLTVLLPKAEAQKRDRIPIERG